MEFMIDRKPLSDEYKGVVFQEYELGESHFRKILGISPRWACAGQDHLKKMNPSTNSSR